MNLQILVFLSLSVVLGCGLGNLEQEMEHKLVGGKAAVVARNGRIVLEIEGRGVRPLLDALSVNPRVFEDAVVMDRIVGRAAAAIYVVAKAQRVMSPVMSADAVEMLDKFGIDHVAGEIVPFIENRDHTGMCPMDSATLEISEPREIVRALKLKEGML